MDEKLLIQLDIFSKTEAKVYTELLHLGSVRVSDIIKNAKLDRRTVYDALSSLEEKGFVCISKRKNLPLIYEVTDPENIPKHYREALEKIEKKRKLLQDVSAELMEMYHDTDTLRIQNFENMMINQELINHNMGKKKGGVYDIIDGTMFWENITPGYADVRYKFKEWPDSAAIFVTDRYGQKKWNGMNIYTVPQEDFPFRGEISTCYDMTGLLVRKSSKAYDERGSMVFDTMFFHLMQNGVKLAIEGVKAILAERKKLLK